MNVNSLDEAKSLPDEEMQRRLALTREILRKAGAHYVIDEFTQLPEVIDDVNERLARGEKP
jgi:phosphonoacetaldehyde hydrolase